MTERWRFRPWILGMLAIGVVAACNAPVKSPSPTSNAPQTLATPLATSAANVLITGCGAATDASPTPQFFSAPAGNASPGSTPPQSTEPASQADALAAAHAALVNSALDHVDVTCVSRQFQESQVAPFITGEQTITSTVWVVVARLTPNGGSTQRPDAGQAAPGPGDGSVQYQIFLASNTRPVVMYSILEYPPGLALPTAFTGMG